MILVYMHDGKCLLTKDNYKQYLKEKYDFYSTYDYAQLNNQEDYENDYYAAALLNEEIYGVEPLNIDLSDDKKVTVSNADVLEDQYQGHTRVLCKGNLQRQPGDEVAVGDFIRDNGYSGFAYTVDDITSYRYLVFYGKKIKDHGQIDVYIYDENGNVTREYVNCFNYLDGLWHQYIIDLTGLSGPATIIFHGGYVDVSGNADSQFVFSDVTLY